MRLFPYAAGLLAAASIFTLASPAEAAAPPVRIAKIYYDSPGPDYRSNGSLNGEYVTIANTSRRTSVRLDGWTLTDASRHRYTFQRGVTIRPGRSVTVRTGQGRDTASVKYQDRRAYVWNNVSDTATVRDRYGRRVDSCSYNSSRFDWTSCR